MKQITVVRMHDDRIDEVVDDRFLHKSGKNKSNGDGLMLEHVSGGSTLGTGVIMCGND